ncbi:GH1 family beta-glucosidase [Allonocardiopsis opalescens]|uniref:Beta-glucosidase n=1 Tax=Allonocardiopsis opalescens TaxID=1144618 RepID=A0A2T0Q6N1_9ACTN|nr:GH1 family beta-glucosidase [Allonocardiopsis opalescens]PRX99452.1 beta-glucosidase [Allonocardiopsis opalescens]
MSVADRPRFPEGFWWGAATSAFQVEGAAAEGGRSPSIWDAFVRRPGAVADGATAETACDHYHRYAEDVALMAELGLSAYRFSTAWTRVQPGGSGPANPEGLDFYERLTDALLERGIAPVLTLFHWDLPQELQERGGWLERDTAYRFAEYAGLVADRLADRVDMWITLNEPFVHMIYGYAWGIHAPGLPLVYGALPAAHHQLLAHGLAVAELRARGVRSVAITNNCSPAWPASREPADLAAADAYDRLHNRLFTDPVLLGEYPDLSAFDSIELPVQDGDLKVISAPLDGLGLNYYRPTLVAAPSPGAGLPFDLPEMTGHPITAFGWPIVPDGLRELLELFHHRYGGALPPLYVTENGASFPDVVADDGTVPDPSRIDFLDGHVRAVAAAIDAGVDVRGYFAWSLLDNFEWAEGYTQRFGLVHVDFETQRRTPKDSFHWYRDLIAAQRGA